MDLLSPYRANVVWSGLLDLSDRVPYKQKRNVFMKCSILLSHLALSFSVDVYFAVATIRDALLKKHEIFMHENEVNLHTL